LVTAIVIAIIVFSPNGKSMNAAQTVSAVPTSSTKKIVT
jgi:hypothetical protein